MAKNKYPFLYCASACVGQYGDIFTDVLNDACNVAWDTNLDSFKKEMAPLFDSIFTGGMTETIKHKAKTHVYTVSDKLQSISLQMDSLVSVSAYQYNRGHVNFNLRFRVVSHSYLMDKRENFYLPSVWGDYAVNPPWVSKVLGHKINFNPFYKHLHDRYTNERHRFLMLHDDYMANKGFKPLPA